MKKGKKKTNVKKFDKKQLKRGNILPSQRMKLCSALKFTANATLSVSKLQPQNNNNINDNNSKIK